MLLAPLAIERKNPISVYNDHIDITGMLEYLCEPSVNSYDHSSLPTHDFARSPYAATQSTSPIR